MKLRRISIVVCVLVLICTGWAVGAQSPEPHLVNANFEDGFSVRESQEVEIGIGWDYSYLSGDDRECPAPCSRPEWKAETQIADGHSQRQFTTYARQFAVIHQIVDVEAGEWYRFSCDVYAISEPMGQMGAFVGINPWANGPFDRTMIWGKEQVGEDGWIYREWTEVSVTAQAFGGKILVAAAGNNQWPTKNNAAYWDNCEIEHVDSGNPEPTKTPQPTPEPCPTCPAGTGCDYGAIRDVVDEALAERKPVVWPQ